MTKMHENELEINAALVQTLLENQCPQWANLPLQAISSSGTEHALFRLGSNYVVRLPRISGLHATLNKEYEWVPKIAAILKTPLSEPVFKGNPDEVYPWFWTITQWNDGHNPEFEKENEYALLARDLAHFINELHAVQLTAGPDSRRGIPLSTKELDDETRQAISELHGDVDILLITSLWNQLSAIPYWDKAPVWIHGDLLPGNILIQNNRLSAVIDFSEVGIGDPACDLVVAWCLFNKQSREIFKENLNTMDNNTWERGRGWALSIAIILLPYYKYSNPVMATLARRMIKNVLDN